MTFCRSSSSIPSDTTNPGMHPKQGRDRGTDTLNRTGRKVGRGDQHQPSGWSAIIQQGVVRASGCSCECPWNQVILPGLRGAVVGDVDSRGGRRAHFYLESKRGRQRRGGRSWSSEKTGAGGLGRATLPGASGGMSAACRSRSAAGEPLRKVVS